MVQAKVRKGSPGGRNVTTKGRICETGTVGFKSNEEEVMGEGISELEMKELVPE